MRESKSTLANSVKYSEFQFPPFWQAFLALLVTISLGIAYGSAVSAMWGWIVGICLSGFAIWWWVSKGVKITVSDQFLRVGKMKIELEYLGKITGLDEIDFLSRIRGQAHRQDVFILRNLTQGGVEIEIKDNRDPFCHWVVTSKQPSKLAAILRDGKVNV